jgi:hypothetical protein
MFQQSIDKQLAHPRTEGGDTIKDPVIAGRLEVVDPGISVVDEGVAAMFPDLIPEIIRQDTSQPASDPVAELYGGQAFNAETEQQIGAQAIRFGNPEVN